MFYWIVDFRKVFTRSSGLLLLIAALGSCRSEKQPATFYPIDSLITAQIRHLSSIRAELFKEAFLSGQEDTLTYVPGDTTGWLNELGVFRKLDIINKPVNKGSYLVDDGLFDQRSNLTVKAFKSLKKLPVVYLKVYYQGNIGKLRKIEALYNDDNVLYRSSRLLSMDFQQIENKTVLTSYEIKGGQKIVLGDSVAFYIRGKILID